MFLSLLRFIENQRYHVPGNTGGGTFNIFVIDITVDQDAAPGLRALRLGTEFNPAAPAYLTVVATC